MAPLLEQPILILMEKFCDPKELLAFGFGILLSSLHLELAFVFSFASEMHRQPFPVDWSAAADDEDQMMKKKKVFLRIN